MILLGDVGRGQGVEGGGLLVLVGRAQHQALGKIVADDSLKSLVAKHQKAGKEASLEEIFLTLTEV